MPTCQQVAQLLNAQRSGDTRSVQAMLEAIRQEQVERGQNRGAEIIERVRLEMQRVPQRTPSTALPRTPFPAPQSQQSHPFSFIQRMHPDEGEPQEVDPNAIPETITGLLVKDESPRQLEDIYLYPPVRDAVNQFLKEYEAQEVLANSGLHARNRIIMAGPPGNGKTVLASAIASKLGMEMYRTDFSQIISAYMGIGPRNLGNIFRFIKEREEPVCLFMDEADAILTSREMLSGQAAGACAQEYRVMVNTVLTGLDEIGSKSLVVAASNFERNLDAAAMRRFNLKLWLKPPAIDGIKKYLEDYQVKKSITLPVEESSIVSLVGQPWSKIEEFCEEQHRAILLGMPCSSFRDWVGR